MSRMSARTNTPTTPITIPAHEGNVLPPSAAAVEEVVKARASSLLERRLKSVVYGSRHLIWVDIGE